MARFVSFIHAEEDIADFRRDFPEHEFFYLSQQAIRGINAIVAGNTFAETMEALTREHSLRPFTGIVFGSEPELYVKAADRVAKGLGLRRFLSDAELVRDKYAMRMALSKKVACPQTRVVGEAEVAANFTDLEFPCVLKPRHGFGSICVFKARNRAELAAAQKGMQAAMAFVAQRHPLAIPTNDMLLENFVGGTEHNIELFLDRGQPLLEIVSDKLEMAPPYFVKCGHVMPSRLPVEAVEKVKAAARHAASAVGIEWGWAHVEVKMEHGVAQVIEIAARPGGGYTREMIKIAYDIDMRRTLIDGCLGKTPAPLPAPINTVFGRNVVCRGIELVFSISGLGDAKKTKGFQVVRNKFHGIPKIFIGPPLSFNNTIMSFFVFNPSVAQAERLFEKFDAQIGPIKLRLSSPGLAALTVLFRTLLVLSRKRLRTTDQK